MVDVGYFIDGRHGVIRNVKIKRYSDSMKYMVFTDMIDCNIYKLDYENIEYIIPHEEECKVNVEDVCKPYTEERMIELCQSVDKPLTNAEKFKEVFGFKPNTGLTMCDLASCNDYSCSNCPYEKICYDWWNEKYTGELNVDAN